MANRNFLSQKMFSGHAMPVHLDCIFTVDATDSHGITGLKGPYVQAVYMNTSATPAAGSPNPVAGTIVMRLMDNYNFLYTVDSSMQSPNGSPSNTVTIGVGVTIVTLGTTTSAQLLAAGFPVGVTAAVGVSFIPLASGAVGGTGTFAPSAAAGSGIATIEILGNPNASLAPTQSTLHPYGAEIILQCRDYAGAIAAPAAGTVIRLSVMLSNSSVTVNGD